MRKAQYVRSKMVNGTRVWFVRPTPALNKVFPDLKIIPSLIDKAKSIPRKTAIPFPPLNLSQTGNICPRKHKRADR